MRQQNNHHQSWLRQIRYFLFSLATVLRSRLEAGLTGYAVCYNGRLRRHGHLFQNAGSWSVVKAMRRALDHHMKSDERILGEDEFIQFVLD